MKTVRQQVVGKSTVRLVRTASGFAGLVVGPSSSSAPIHGEDPDALWRRLLGEVGKAHPDYFGYDGAKARFKRAFPEGFSDSDYLREERAYKLEAVRRVAETLPEGAALEASHDIQKAALRAFQATNLVSPFEKARIKDVLAHPEGANYLRAAATFAAGQVAAGLASMVAAIRAAGQAPSWPVLTYLPFLWRPDQHLFLKPQVTRDFAVRVGHPFDQRYEEGLVPDVYAALLELADETRGQLSDLRPQDLIDVQGFIWVVGAYSEKDLAAKVL